ncbi:type 1 periplasmic binding fold superfamily protein [Flavobacterium myungsuense]|uniref:Type 1 periplasmic binding fold superfamily protein n=1 Tax=Flavobacterium myungsuense TaxID=651823 RepID=A0ABW3IYW1_9FLAO
MKNSKILAIALVSIFTFSSCSDDDDKPTPVIEEEVITTLTAVYTPVGGGTAITLQSRDLDGDGPNDPLISVSGKFAQGTIYNGVVTFLNETESPAEDKTEEIKELALEHQVFYQKTGGINNIIYADTPSNKDSNGNPIGLESVFTTTGAATGTIRIILKHEPNKSALNVANGDVANAGGSTDIEADFDIVVE